MPLDNTPQDDGDESGEARPSVGSFEVEEPGRARELAAARPSAHARKSGLKEHVPEDVIARAMNERASMMLGEEVPAARPAGVSYRDAVIVIIVNATGVALVLFPKIMSDVGVFMAVALCGVCAMLCSECGHMICTACNVAEKALGFPRLTTYEGLAEAAAGTLGKQLLTVTKNCSLAGFVVAFMQLLVDSLATFLPGEEDQKPVLLLRFLVVVPLFCVLGMLKDLSILARFSNLGMAAVFVQCGSIIVGGIGLSLSLPTCKGSPADDCLYYTLLPEKKVSELPGATGKYLAVFLFANALLAMVPSLRSQLAEPEQMRSILARAFLILFFSNSIVMAFGYAGFGVSAPDNIIVGISERFPKLGTLGSCAVIINVLVSYPMAIFCIVSAFEATGTGPLFTPLAGPNIIFRVSVVVLLGVIGASLPYITQVIGICSSVFAVLNNVLFPAVFHWLARRKAQRFPKNPVMRQVKYVIAFIIGIVVMVFGLEGSISDLADKFAEAAEAGKAVALS